MRTLATMQAGETGIIQAIHAEQVFRYRLAAMGFRVGKRVEVIRQARALRPLYVRVGSTDFMIRPAEAQHIDVI